MHRLSIDKKINITDLIDVSEIQEIQDAFSDAFGIASRITDLKGKPITEQSNFSEFCNLIHNSDKGRHDCNESGRHLCSKALTCHFPYFSGCLGGLTDAVARISVKNVHLANWRAGQVKFKEVTAGRIQEYAAKIGVDEERLVAAYAKIPLMDEKRFQKIINLMNIISKKISSLLLHNLRLRLEMDTRRKAEKDVKNSEKQLMHADKLAALGTMVSGIGHEINNPNNSIMLNAPFLKEAWESILPHLDEVYKKDQAFKIAGIPYHDARTYMESIPEDIINCSERIKKIIDELKNFARPHATEDREPVKINRAIENAVHLLGNMIKKATCSFTLNYGKELPATRANFLDMEHMLINLIQNSCQALTDQKRSITVTSEYDESNDEIMVKVCDQGSGISREDLDKITDPFFTTKRDNGGTGLGLSIVHRIIKQHEGRLEIKSVVGKGTRVIVTLPVKRI